MIVKINGAAIENVRKDFQITERKDEELDSGVIVIVSTRAEQYDPFTKVEILMNDVDVDYTFLIDSDQVILLKKDSPFYYQHTISMIEPTKILERIIVDNISFTQPRNEAVVRYYMDDVLIRLRDITPLRKLSEINNYAFTFDSALLTQLETIPAPQFRFNNQNLLQVLIEIFRYFNAFPRVKTFSGSIPVITADYFNDYGTIIDISNYINKAQANNAEYYVNKLDIQLENGIPDELEVFPLEPNVAILTSESLVVSTNELVLKTPKPIYAIKKIIMVNRYFTQTNPDILSTHREIDITSLVYEEQAYKLLPTDSVGNPSKFGSLVYKQGNNTISGFGLTFPQFLGLYNSSAFEDRIFDNPNWDDITYTLPSGTTTTLQNFTAGVDGLGVELLNGVFGFRVYYYPYISQRVNVVKQVPNVGNDYTITSNQSGKALDINRGLTNAQGVIDRLGNGEVMLEKSVSNFNDRYKVGQRISTGETIVSVETTIDDDFYLSKAMLSKNFNRLSQFVGVDREFRQYEIPLEDQQQRNMLLNEYVLFSFTSVANNNSSISSYWKGLFSSMFSSNVGSNLYIGGAAITTSLSSTFNTATNIGNFLLSFSRSYYKNSNIFHFNFRDSQVGYFRPEKEAGTFFESFVTKLNPIKYVYVDPSNEDNVNNGKANYLFLRLLSNNFYKELDEMVIQVANETAMRANYASFLPPPPNDTYNNHPYPYGLYYKLATPYTDFEGNTWTYILFGSEITAFELEPRGRRPEDVYTDLIYNMFAEAVYPTDPNFKASTSHPKYLGSVNTRIRDQLSINYDYLGTNKTIFEYLPLVVMKDTLEALSLTFQLHYLPNDPDIIIGLTMSKNSPFIKARSELTTNGRSLHLYRSTEYYRSGDLKAKGTKTTTAFSGFTVVTDTNGYRITLTTSTSGFNSWAIGDNDGNLYFAVNKKANGTFNGQIYISFKNKL